MWPASFWERIYEPLIRRAAGLGRARAPGPRSLRTCQCLLRPAGDRQRTRRSFRCACGRARRRASDPLRRGFVFGGRLVSDQQEVDGAPGVFGRGPRSPNLPVSGVRLMPRTTVFGCYDDGVYGALERVSDHPADAAPYQPRQRLWRIVAKRAVLAAGAIERAIVFGGNDRPGVMMSARRALTRTALRRQWDGRFLSSPITMTVGVRRAISSRMELRRCVGRRQAGCSGCCCNGFRWARPARCNAHRDKGRPRRRCGAGSDRTRSKTVACDAFAVSGGWDPNIGLACHHGARPNWREEIAAFVPAAAPKGMTVVGAANGTMTLAACIREGSLAARSLVEALGFKVIFDTLPRAHDEDFEVRPFWHVSDSIQKAFVDFQNDVTAEDVMLAAREGFRSVEHLKRYTTLGMATDQGRTANVVGLAMMAALTGRSIPATGTLLIGRPIRRSQSVRSPDLIVARHFGRSAVRLRMLGPGARRHIHRGRSLAAGTVFP